jgi:hypothetical protein
VQLSSKENKLGGLIKMSAPTLSEMGKIIVKKAPRKGGIYFARRSFEPGVVPTHLEPYASTCGGDARACAAATTGMKGNARVIAMNGCFAGKRRKGGHK